jgi:hypothetical protein
VINAKYTLGRNTGNTFQPTPAEQELYRALGANMFGSAVRLEQEHVSFTAPEAGLSGAGDKPLDCQCPPLR